MAFIYSSAVGLASAATPAPIPPADPAAFNPNKKGAFALAKTPFW